MFPDTCCIKQTLKVTVCEMCLQYPGEAKAFCHKPNKNICNFVTETWKIEALNYKSGQQQII